jgi:DNA mismatch endonuclease (patch repair protein)
MSRIRGRGNERTELALVRLLRANRITGWRRHAKLPGRPDFVFRKERVVVFVDGCFWHGCPKCFRQPNTNKAFWRQKISANRTRDKKVGLLLRTQGWRILRIWEHALRQAPAMTTARVRRILLGSRSYR